MPIITKEIEIPINTFATPNTSANPPTTIIGSKETAPIREFKKP